MFWKWKGKKKDSDEPGNGEAESSAVTTKTEDDSAEEPGPGTADDRETAAGADAEDTAATEAGGTSAEDADDEEEAGDKDTASVSGDDGQDDAEAEVPGTDTPDRDRIQCVRTAGVLKVDDEEFDVVSNTWVVEADDDGVIVIDPAHDSKAILEAVGDREVYLVACTNGYNTHVSAAVEVAERDDAPIALHPRELRSWRKAHGVERRPDHEIEGGGTLQVGDLEVDVLAIPGTSTGSVGFYISERGAVFSGDTLRKGELGTVGEGYIDYTRQLHSVGEVLLSLPPDTRVLPDSGPETMVEAESKNFDSWVSTS
ncbi:MBL fold metallo-hydrolase [Allosalinactinospora lopnorensis]|uniref:MBL fold metallo-hydrolase n=1 Tax=Allosalinactinospora lopnorensis TaxID=1352348 RepID=UPI000623C407|nr:MBL fold metallo-hydrolase [Allosalinactinospora lopnorensis]